MKAALVQETITAIDSIHRPHPIRVGVDGLSASGKTKFADSLVQPLRDLGRHVIRASIDGFHHPKEIRYRQGENNVAGYVEDSFDKTSVVDYLLHPLGPTGNREYRESLFDFVSNENTQASLETAHPDSILIFEGVMLFCDQLRDHFDYRVFVDVDFETVVNRALVRDVDRLGGREKLLKKYRERYIPGQQLYIERHDPVSNSHIVIDNRDFSAPVVLSRNIPIRQP